MFPRPPLSRLPRRPLDPAGTEVTGGLKVFSKPEVRGDLACGAVGRLDIPVCCGLGKEPSALSESFIAAGGDGANPDRPLRRPDERPD